MARNIFIGDVHGCLDEFEALIRKIEPGREDRVFCVGDFMDRGPKPAECVRFARESGFQSVLGNHEEKHLRWRRHEDRRARDPKYQNPMRPLPPQRQAENAALTAEDIAWLEGLPLVLEPLPGWILVHGGLFPGKSIAAHLKDRDLRDKIIRLRWLDADGEFVKLEDDTAAEGPPGSQPWMQAYDGRANVVYGHAVHSLSTPRIDVQHHATHETKTFGIDTGCVFGGALTALIVEERRCLEVVQVRAKKVYAEPRVPIHP